MSHVLLFAMVGVVYQAATGHKIGADAPASAWAPLLVMATVVDVIRFAVWVRRSAHG